MKRVHKALQLRHYKHTAKILPHKHTSYGALFVLMCAPIAMLALVGHLAFASDYSVTATVPAQMPTGAPSITSPPNGFVTDSGSVVVSGTCPVAQPAIVIVVYDGSLPAGSVRCSPTGSFSLPVTLSYGVHSFVAKVMTITGESGASSNIVTITRRGAGGQSAGGYAGSGLSVPFYVVPTEPFLATDSNGQVTWRGKFTGGMAPYSASIDWGDGSESHYDVSNSEEQSFVHVYDSVQEHHLIITATDSHGTELVYHMVTVAFLQQKHALLDVSSEQVHPLVGFVQRNAVQIYIFTLSALLFLWYLEHGRHVAGEIIKQSVQAKAKKRRRRKV